MFTVTNEIYRERMNLCRRCKYFKQNTQTCGTPVLGEEVTFRRKQYRLCGCIMPIKAKLKIASCSVNKWLPTVDREMMIKAKEVLDKLPPAGHRLGRINSEQQEAIHNAYVALTGMKAKRNSCSACWTKMINRLRIHFDDEL